MAGRDNSLDPNAMLNQLPAVPGGINGADDGLSSAQGGGVEMNPQPEAPAPPPVPARLEQPAPVPQQPEAPMQVGQGREDQGAQLPPLQAEAPQAAPPPKPDSMPLAVYERLRDQWQQERDQRIQYEAQTRELAAYRQQTEPLMAAFRQEWPAIQGLKAEKARLEQEAQFEKAAREYSNNSWASGQTPDMENFARNWRTERVLQQAANLPQTIEATIDARLRSILDNRDQSWAQQQQMQQAQTDEARRAAAVAQFEKEYAELEVQTPQIAGLDGLKRAAFIDWANGGGQKPVREVATPYLRGFQSQQVAAQAAQMTRAEVHASMPRTLSGGSGAASAPQTNSMRPPIEVIRGGSRAIATWHQQRLRQAAGR